MKRITVFLITALLVTVVGCNNNANTITTDLSTVFPKEVKIDGTTYRKQPDSSEDKVDPSVMTKFFKGLGEYNKEKVRYGFYLSPKEDTAVVFVGKYESADAATKAMSEIKKDPEDNVWTKGNLLFVSNKADLKNNL
jgi:hypothetical protein